MGKCDVWLVGAMLFPTPFYHSYGLFFFFLIQEYHSAVDCAGFFFFFGGVFFLPQIQFEQTDRENHGYLEHRLFRFA